jgi:hypothetical protein
MRVCQFRHFGTEFARLPGTGARNYLAGITILQNAQLLSNLRRVRTCILLDQTAKKKPAQIGELRSRREVSSGASHQGTVT